MDGLLLIDKPKGWTSFDVVAKVRGVLRAQLKSQGLPYKIKVGHTGTLDPLATGLLVLAVGSYTKKVPQLTAHSKTYKAVVCLGQNSTTDDAEGQLTAGDTNQPTLALIASALQSFVGTIAQMPPQFSAIKVGGVRSYKAARQGKQLALEPRMITIYSISGITYAYPLVSFECLVGSGTYIRSLARDLGAALGTGAYLADLQRTTVGAYDLSQAVSVTGLTAEIVRASLIL